MGSTDGGVTTKGQSTAPETQSTSNANFGITTIEPSTAQPTATSSANVAVTTVPASTAASEAATSQSTQDSGTMTPASISTAKPGGRNSFGKRSQEIGYYSGL